MWDALLIFLCVMVLFVLFQLSFALRRLGRIERLLSQKELLESHESSSPALEVRGGGAFEAFLKEDPARVGMTKKEQATAYRRWRQDKGLNWSKPSA